MLTYGSTNIISESIVSTIDNLVEKATLKRLTMLFNLFLKKVFSKKFCLNIHNHFNF